MYNGKSDLEIDDLGVSLFQETSIYNCMYKITVYTGLKLTFPCVDCCVDICPL